MHHASRRPAATHPPRPRAVHLTVADLRARPTRVFTLAKPGSELTLTLLLLGARNTMGAVTVRLAAPRTRVTIAVAALGVKEAAHRLALTVLHEAPDTQSRVRVRGALRDRSRLTLPALVRIAKGADGADARLEAKSLSLSAHAIARIDPNLEVLAHRVKASHGAAAGRMRPQDLFYLQSRGFGRRAAERIALLGLFHDTMELFPPAALRALTRAL